MTLTVIPAIDIRGGRCVQLVQGDYRRETVYGEDPADMARRWQAEGAQRLHIVDLDGARDGTRANATAVRRVLHAVSIPVQVGGGVRTLDAARDVLEQGADRVVVGTAAAQQVDEVAEWVSALGADHLIVGVDARQSKVATHGWRETTHLEVTGFCQALRQAGVGRVLYTDIERDGTLTGPNVAATRRIASIVTVIASGGISSVEHLRQLGEAGAEAAIVGTALYDGRLRLQDALAAC